MKTTELKFLIERLQVARQANVHEVVEAALSDCIIRLQNALSICEEEERKQYDWLTVGMPALGEEIKELRERCAAAWGEQ